MDTDTITTGTRTTTEPPSGPDGPDGRQLRRPARNRMLGGVAAGIADYLGVDATLVRVGFAVLTVMGGAGIPLYLAGLFLIPDQDSGQSLAASLIHSLQSR